MALEDAYTLSNPLGSVQKMSKIEGVFKAYDAVRRHRTQKLVAESRDAGKAYDFGRDGIRDSLDAVRKTLGTGYNWIWDKNLEDLAQAMSMMGVRLRLKRE